MTSIHNMKQKLNAGILITGNEILGAKTKDTNGPFIGMHLRKIGVPVRASMFCGDEESDLLDCLGYLALRCEVIFMTGGLGPTSDDLTAAILAKFFNIKTVFYEKAWQNCIDAYKKLNRRDIPESNKKQAFLPENSKILSNKIGTAVGFKVSGIKFDKNISVYCMPGVPYEMEAMFLNEVYPELTSHCIRPIYKTWQVFLMGESAMQTAINEQEIKLKNKFSDASISYQAHPGMVTYTVTLFPHSEKDHEKMGKFLEGEFIPALHKKFNKHILYSNDKSVPQYIIEALQKKFFTFSCIEGSTGGVLSKEFTTKKNIQEVWKGSIILNLNDLSQSFLDLSEFLNGNFSIHSENGISFLANSGLSFFQADICIAECGFPCEELTTNKNNHGCFYLALGLNKRKIKNESILQTRLFDFGWKKNPINNHENDYLIYTCEMKVSPRFVKEVQQTRTAFHCLCSLAMIVDLL